MQETDDIPDMIDSFILVNNSMAIDQNKGEINAGTRRNIDDLVILSARLMQRKFTDAWTQTNRGFFDASPIINDSQLSDKEAIFDDKCMDHDIVLVSNRRLDDDGNLLIDAWTRTETLGPFYSWPNLTEDELSDDATLFDEDSGPKISESDQNSILKDSLHLLIQKVRSIFHILRRGRINDSLKFWKMRLMVGIHYGSIYLERIGCIVLSSGKFVMICLANYLIK